MNCVPLNPGVSWRPLRVNLSTFFNIIKKITLKKKIKLQINGDLGSYDSRTPQGVPLVEFWCFSKDEYHPQSSQKAVLVFLLLIIVTIMCIKRSSLLRYQQNQNTATDLMPSLTWELIQLSSSKTLSIFVNP